MARPGGPGRRRGQVSPIVARIATSSFRQRAIAQAGEGGVARPATSAGPADDQLAGRPGAPLWLITPSQEEAAMRSLEQRLLG
jgi:hypothetical protein